MKWKKYLYFTQIIYKKKIELKYIEKKKKIRLIIIIIIKIMIKNYVSLKKEWNREREKDYIDNDTN